MTVKNITKHVVKFNYDDKVSRLMPGESVEVPSLNWDEAWDLIEKIHSGELDIIDDSEPFDADFNNLDKPAKSRDSISDREKRFSAIKMRQSEDD